MFNVMLEFHDPGGDRVTRLVAGLRYEPSTPKLVLVTLF
jgi:hypothetical protein